MHTTAWMPIPEFKETGLHARFFLGSPVSGQCILVGSNQEKYSKSKLAISHSKSRSSKVLIQVATTSRLK